MSLDKYETLQGIKKGGMAEIFVAREKESGRRVALKILMSQLAEDPEFQNRFRHEALAHQGLHHPNIVELYDWGDAGNRPYLALEFVDGATLSELLERFSRLPPEVALYILQEVLKGLQHAHENHLVHRDVKPSNVLIGRNGEVKIADFGIATGGTFTRLTQTGMVVGTPDYMSPEQASGQPPDHRTDLFAAGIVLFEMLAGRHPFKSDNQAATLRRIIDCEYEPLFEVNPTILPELETLTLNLMEADPARRYQSANDALKDLATALLALERDPLNQESLAKFLSNPAGETSARFQELSTRHAERADSVYRDGAGSPALAAWELHLATQLDPSSQETKEKLERLLRNHQLLLHPEPDPDLDRLEQLVSKNPQAPAFLLNLAAAYVSSGAVVNAMFTFVRLLRLGFRDDSAMELIAKLFGDEHLAAVDRTRTLVPLLHTRKRRRTTTRVTPVQPVESPQPPPPPRPPSPASTPSLIAPVEVVLIGLGLVMLALAASLGPIPKLVMTGGAGFMLGFALRPLLMLRWHPAELFEKAHANLEKGTFSRAEWMFRRYRRWFPQDRRAGAVALGLGRSLISQGRAMEALEILYLGLPQMDPTSRITAHKMRVDIMSRQGRLDAAADEHRAIMETGDPKAAPEAALSLAEILKGSERYQDALDVVEEMLHEHPKAAEVLDGMLLRSELLLAVGRGMDALKAVKDLQDRVSHQSEWYRRSVELSKQISQQSWRSRSAIVSRPSGSDREASG